MPISAQKARALCTKSEYALVRASLPSYIGALTPAALKRDTKRARTLRDKYRKLAERQKREAKGGGAKGAAKPRSTRPAAGAANTKLKAQIFAEALARYEAASKQASTTSKKKPAGSSKTKAKRRPPGKKTVAKKKVGTGKKAIREKAAEVKAAADTAPDAAPEKKPAKKKKRTKSRVGKSSFAAELALKQGRMRRAGTTRIRTHVSARGRRQQARRDSRSR